MNDKPTRGPGGKLRKWERIGLRNSWFIGKRGQRVDVLKNAQTAADNTGMDQAVHAHRYDQACDGLYWPDEQGRVRPGECSVIEPDPTTLRATGGSRRAKELRDG